MGLLQQYCTVLYSTVYLSMGPYGVPGSRDSWTRDLGSRDSWTRDLGSWDSGARDPPARSTAAIITRAGARPLDGGGYHSGGRPPARRRLLKTSGCRRKSCCPTLSLLFDFIGVN